MYALTVAFWITVVLMSIWGLLLASFIVTKEYDDIIPSFFVFAGMSFVAWVLCGMVNQTYEETVQANKDIASVGVKITDINTKTEEVSFIRAGKNCTAEITFDDLNNKWIIIEETELCQV